jgi:urease alpha subunit
VSQASLDAGFARHLGTRRSVVAVQGTREVRRAHLVANTATASVEVDPADGTVRLDGRVLASEPSATLPLNRAYLLG